MDGMNGPTPSIAQSQHDRYSLVHAVFGSVATFITAPGAILVARYCRTWRHWAKLHWALNAFTAIFLIINFATINVIVGNQYSGRHADLHHQLGLAIFIIVLVQTALGVGAAFTKYPAFNCVVFQRSRPALRFVHMAFGIATMAILYAQVYTGFDEWNETSDSMTIVPRGIIIAFWVLFAVEIFAYGVGWVVMEPLGRKKRAGELSANGGEKGRNSTSGLTAGTP